MHLSPTELAIRFTKLPETPVRLTSGLAEVENRYGTAMYRVNAKYAIRYPRLKREYIDPASFFSDLRVARSIESDYSDSLPTYKGKYLELAKKKKRQSITSDKRPKDTRHYTGIEIEFFAPVSEDSLIRKLLDANLADYVTLKDDGSIRVPEDSDSRSFELCVLAPTEELTDIVNRVCKVLQWADADVNASCGLHVHLDMRSHPARSLAFNNLVKCQRWLFAMVSPSRRTNTFCKRVRGSHISYRRDRYRAINARSLHKHSTIEIRLHQGTVNAEKILFWCHVLQQIVTAPNIEKTPGSISKLVQILGGGNYLEAGIRSRVAKYKVVATPRPYNRPQPTSREIATSISEASANLTAMVARNEIYTRDGYIETLINAAYPTANDDIVPF